MGSKENYISEKSHLLSTEWYKNIVPEIEYYGISLGSIVEMQLYPYFFDLLKKIERGEDLKDRSLISKFYVPIHKQVIRFGPQVKHIAPTIKNYFTNFDEIYGKNILAVTWGNNIFQLRSLVKSLRAEGYDARFLILNLGAQKELQKEKVPYIYLNNYRKNEHNDFIDLRHNLREVWNELKSNEKFHDLFSYADVKLWSYVNGTIRDLFTRDFIEIAKDIDSITNILKTEKPDLVIVPSDSLPKEKTIVLTCNSQNIPTLQVQHGLLSKNITMLLPISSDKIAVWSKSRKDLLVNSDVPKDKIVITGRPRFDKIKEYGEVYPKIIVKNRVYEKLNIDNSKDIILFAPFLFIPTSHYSQDERINFIRNIIKICCSFKEYQLVIKLHPLDKQYEYARILREENINAKIVKDIEVYDLLSCSELVIQSYSTIGFEAMLFGKPVINIGFNRYGNYLPECTVGVNTEEELKYMINDILYNSDVRHELIQKSDRYVDEFNVDGNSTRRVISLIEEMIK